MKHKLHADLDALYRFFTRARQSLPESHSYGAGIVSRPSVFTLKDLQRHLENPLLNPDWLQVVLKAENVPLEHACLFKMVQKRNLVFIDKQFINQQLQNGAAVVLEGLDILESRINSFLAKVDDAFPCVLANCVAFFSQKDNEAYKAHCDTDDVLVFQLEGKKTWHLFAPQQRRYFGASNLTDAELGPVVEELVMRPGDALYLRAGVPHRCLTPGSYSLHLSIDLGDRTPNVEQITAQADKLYKLRAAPGYCPASNKVEHYVGIMQSDGFKAALEQETRSKRAKIGEFRQQIGRSTGISYLSKLK